MPLPQLKIEVIPDGSFLRRFVVHHAIQIPFSAFNSWADAKYHLTPLGFFPGWNNSVATGLNNRGEIVGRGVINGVADTHAFLWTSSGGMQDLGTLGGRSSSAYGINDAGQVVGVADPANDHGLAFVWTKNGGMQALPSLGGDFSVARFINANGEIAGSSRTPFHDYAAKWSSNGQITNLGSINGGSNSNGYGINATGQVVGWTNTDPNLSASYAFIWSSSGGMVEIPNFGGTVNGARAINASGQVVGQSGGKAFLWTSTGGLKDLGSANFTGSSFEAVGINDNGVVVGSYQNPFSTFIWNQSGGMQAISSLLDSSGNGWRLDSPQAINSLGQIVGSGRDPLNRMQAFLLTPIPEPSGVALALIGAAVLVAWRVTDHRKRRLSAR